MARKTSEVYVFSHLGQAEGHRFVPAGIHGRVALPLSPANSGGITARAELCTLELARRCGLTVPEVRYPS